MTFEVLRQQHLNHSFLIVDNHDSKIYSVVTVKKELHTYTNVKDLENLN